MRNAEIFKLFRKYNLKRSNQIYLLCPICHRPFCNSFSNEFDRCDECKDKQLLEFNGLLFCGENKLPTQHVPSCNCGKRNSMEKSVFSQYLIILLDYIENLEYQLICKEEKRNSNEFKKA